MRSVYRRLVVLVLGAAALCGCGGSSPTSPASSAVPIVVYLVPVGGSYSATLQGQTYTASGGFSVSLAPGIYTITGTIQAQGLAVGFGTLGGNAGGVQSGSPRSVSGPSPLVESCKVSYFPSTVGASSFSVQFTLTSSANSACQNP